MYKYKSARTWFGHALEMRPSWGEARYGFELCCFQLFRKGRDVVPLPDEEQLLDFLGNDDVPLPHCVFGGRNNELRFNSAYLRAVCLKSLKEFERADRSYKALLPEVKKQENRHLIKHVFGLILLPLQDDRKVNFDKCYSSQYRLCVTS